MTKVRGTGESIQMDEDWFVRRDGSMFPVSYTSTPIDMPDGPGVVVAFKDIEEQRAAEQALREREAILATVGQPVWVTDAAGRFHYANPAALAALGYDAVLEPRRPPRRRPRPLQVPRRHAVPRGRLPARPGPQGGGDAPGHRRLARGARTARSCASPTRRRRSSCRTVVARSPPSPTSRSSAAPSRRRASATSPRRERPSCASRENGKDYRRQTHSNKTIVANFLSKILPEFVRCIQRIIEYRF